MPDLEAGTDLVGEQPVPRRFTLVFERREDGPRIVLRCGVEDGVPQVFAVEILAKSRPLASSDFDDIRIEDLLEVAVTQAVLWSDGLNIAAPDANEGDSKWPRYLADRDAALRTLVNDTRVARSNARRRVNDDFLRDVARVYRDNVDGSPTQAVADFTGRAHRTAALYVKQAREAGLLGAASPGKKGEQ